MIKQYSRLRVIDNSGAREVMCISTGVKKTARIGDVIKVSVKSVFPNSTVKRKTMYKALIVQTRASTLCGFVRVKFHENCVILLDETLNPIGNSITRPIPSEVKTAYPQLSKMSIQIV